MNFPKYLIKYCLVFGIISCSKQNNDKTLPLFTFVSSESSNINFVNKIKENAVMNVLLYEYYHNGGGVAIGDINNDGLSDIFFTSNIGKDKLYLNLGKWKFRDITDEAGITHFGGFKTGVSMVDINGNGWLDIYVCRSGNLGDKDRENLLYINTGNLTFSEDGAAYGLNDNSYSTQAAFFDCDNDGDLDMYLLNHQIHRKEMEAEQLAQEVDTLSGDKLYININGQFVNEGLERGIESNALGFGLGIAIDDLDNDGWMDIYVTNDYLEHDYLYMNRGNGYYEESIHQSIKHTSFYSMGVDIADIDNNGYSDIFVVDMVAKDYYRLKTNMSGMDTEKFYAAIEKGFHHQYMTNTLQINHGNNKYSELAQMAGVDKTDWSWTPLIADFDGDGLQDIIVTNGLRKEARNNDFLKIKRKYFLKIDSTDDRTKQNQILKELLDLIPSQKLSNFAFKNEGNINFKDITKTWGLNLPSFSNGAVYGDLDNDGDLDLVINNVDEKAFLYKNNSTSNFLTVTFDGMNANKYGIGCIVEIYADSIYQKRTNMPVRGYQSSVEGRVHFGLGTIAKIDSMHILWPSGKHETQYNVKTNQNITFHEIQARTINGRYEIEKPKIFRDITAETIGLISHNENKFNDFERELLLPHKMSEFGPALAIGDITNDGLEDIYLGGSKGFAGQLLIQNKTGKFTSLDQNVFEKYKESEDVAASFVDLDNDEDLDLLIASGSNEMPANNPKYQDRIYLNSGNGEFTDGTQRLPRNSSSSSKILSSDVDGNGEIDLFICGRSKPGAYPLPEKSTLLLSKNKKFVPSPESLVSNGEIKIVTDGVFVDLNNDNKEDLILVGEWEAIRVFINHDGILKEESIPELSKLKGWWNCIKKIDYDNDGDFDFIVGNLGLNYKYKSSITHPFDLYFSDFDSNGKNDIVLSYYNNDVNYPLRGLQCSSTQIPELNEKFDNYHSFASSDLIDVYGQKELSNAYHLEATIFESILLINNGNLEFKVEKLSNEFQTSNINACEILDFDKNGYSDIVVGGNLYGSEVETPRNDAGYGIAARNLSGKKIEGLPISASGLCIDGQISNIKKIKIYPDKQALVFAVNDRPLKIIEY